MPNYNIVTDSCCDLRPETYEQLNLTVVPLSMEFRGRDSRFWNSFLFTFVFAICSVICINAVGFGLPLVAPAFAIGLFLSISDSFKMFDQNLSLTAGGPANSTEMIALNIYNTAFKESKLGQAQAKAVVFLIVVVVISVTQLILSRRKEVEM